MPMWSPPTPPRLDNDVYADNTMCFLYDSAIMTESQLPQVYVKKEKKRRHESSHGVPKKKLRASEDVPPARTPRSSYKWITHWQQSLFDRPSAALLKMRREKGMLRHGSSVAASASYQGHKITTSGSQKTLAGDTSPHDQPEWLIHEDWSLLQAVQTLLQLPLNLTILSPAHIPNWDLVSDVVSATSRIYRSSKQCRIRYENCIIPREEGKILYDVNPRKPLKKNKGIYKTKNNKPMRTGQLFTQDGNSSVTTLHAFRFDCIKNVSSKRTPTLRPTLVAPTMKNPKHAAVLAESGISYDQPKNPEEVAKIRQERIRNEKKAAQVEQQQQQALAASQRATQLAARQAVQTGSTPTVQLQQLPVTGTLMTSASKAALASITRTLPSLVVNTPSNSSFSMAKRLAQGSTVVTTGVQSVTTTIAATTQRHMTVQEMQQLRAGRGVTTTMTQFMRQMPATATTGVAGAPRTITVQQQPLTISQPPKGLTTNQLAQLNLLKQRTGGTLVAQRTASQLVSGSSQVRPTVHKTGGQTKQFQTTRVSETDMQQLLKQRMLQQQQQHQKSQPQQTVVAGSVPTLVKTVSTGGGSTPSMTIPVSAAVNINVSLPQQQKTAVIGHGTKSQTITANTQQLRQIQFLQHKQGRAVPQKITGLNPQQLGTKPASVQIVQQPRSGVTTQKLGVHQIQQLIKQQQAQQQAQQQHTQSSGQIQQIITAPHSSSTPTIIATTQLITPANMHATITKMSAPVSSTSTTVSAVTVSLANRPVSSSSSSSTVAIVPTASGNPTATSLVASSPSKSLTAASTPGRLSAGTSVPQQSPVISLATVTLQSQPSVSATLMNKLPVGSTSGMAVPRTSLQATTIITAASQQVSLAKSTVPTPATTPAPPAPVVVTQTPAQTPATVTSSPVDPHIVQTPLTLSTVPAAGATVTIATTDVEHSESGAPDSTRTYAMRPRKTN